MLEGKRIRAPRMREIHRWRRSRRAIRCACSDHRRDRVWQGNHAPEEVHDSSPARPRASALPVCSAVHREMLDSHLLVIAAARSPGRSNNFLGVIRANEGGTLFLDEIGEVRLDRAGEAAAVPRDRRSGSGSGETKAVKVTCAGSSRRTISRLRATSRTGDSARTCSNRLNVRPGHHPALRERREEILPFFERFPLRRECAAFGRQCQNLSAGRGGNTCCCIRGPAHVSTKLLNEGQASGGDFAVGPRDYARHL